MGEIQLKKDKLYLDILELGKMVLNNTIHENDFYKKYAFLLQKNNSLEIEEYNYAEGQLRLLKDLFEYKNRTLFLSKSKYVTDIIQILHEQDMLSHQELASFLGIKKNHLSNIMKNYGLAKVLCVKKVGRIKLYSLKGDFIE